MEEKGGERQLLEVALPEHMATEAVRFDVMGFFRFRAVEVWPWERVV